MFERGQTYYRITYADAKMTMPGVKPMIYLGTNRFPRRNENELVHYFQDTVSVMVLGYADCESDGSKNTRDIEAKIYSVEGDDLSSIASILEVAGIIEKAAFRAQNLEFPVISPNSWRGGK